MPIRLLTASIVLVTIAILLESIPVNAQNPQQRFETCSVNAQYMTRFMGGGVSQNLGYVFNVTALTNTSFTVGVWGTRGDPTFSGNVPFMGLLLWATDQRGQRVGNWQLRPDNMGYELVCEGRAITHDVVGGRSMLSIDPARPSGFVLNVPVGLPQPIVMRGAIIQSMTAWQILNPTPAPPLNPATAATALAAIRASSASSLNSSYHSLMNLFKSISFTGLTLSLLIHL